MPSARAAPCGGPTTAKRRTSGGRSSRVRWSIVEIVESDGKRLLLARSNRPDFPDLAALTADENDVVWLATLGHSYKYIGYELGLTVSSVLRRLRRAMTKLGVSTRAELVRKLAR